MCGEGNGSRDLCTRCIKHQEEKEAITRRLSTAINLLKAECNGCNDFKNGCEKECLIGEFLNQEKQR